jgi:hypothetical protein
MTRMDWDWDDDEDELRRAVLVPVDEADDNWCCYPGLVCQESRPDGDVEGSHGSPGQ